LVGRLATTLSASKITGELFPLGDPLCGRTFTTMSDDKDQPDLEHVGSDMEKVGLSFHHGRHPSRATDEYYRLSKSCPSLSFPELFEHTNLVVI
jgi:hypothetical protein